MSDFIQGDAFQGDRGSHKAFGVDILNDDYAVSSIEQETPESKCNSVSFMNIDIVAPNCRNLLAVSDSYICYAIKRSKLRVIHTVSTQTVLLKGHEFPILDLKFSPADKTILCSVDDISDDTTGTSGCPRIIIWQLHEGEGQALSCSILSQFAIGATIVQPHPKLAHVWAVAKGSSVGIVTVELGKGGAGEKITSYKELSISRTYPGGSISDLSFSADGSMLAVATLVDSSSDLIFFNLPSSDLLVQGKGSLIPAHMAAYPQLNLSVLFLPCGILTASNASSTSNAETIQLKLWSPDYINRSNSLLQSIKVTFPIHSSAVNKTTNESLVFALNNGCNKYGKFVVLFHRKSNMVACLALNQNGKKGLPLCHVTFLDLKLPIFSLDITTVAAKDHHSDEEVEHLEICCYQDKDALRNAVQQYHIPCYSLYNPEAIPAGRIMCTQICIFIFIICLYIRPEKIKVVRLG
jgi:hypothetical protein